VLIGGSFFMVDGLTRNGIARLNDTLLSPQRPVLQIAGPSNGRFKVRFSAASGQTYFLMATTNCIDWVPVGRPTEPASGLFEFEDPDSGSLPQRFYRAFSP
jgi:hypothetical protein